MTKRKPRLLVACEFSAIVRDAFRSQGVNAFSCDLLPTEGNPRWHIQGDVREILDDGWAMMIAHPPCTYLAGSGSRWHQYEHEKKEDALRFVKILLDADIPRIALENPVSIIATRIRKPDQILEPYYFGESYSKATCLWLKNLPMIAGTKWVEPGVSKTLSYRPDRNRWKDRSRFSRGMAVAMATQWRKYVE